MTAETQSDRFEEALEAVKVGDVSSPEALAGFAEICRHTLAMSNDGTFPRYRPARALWELRVMLICLAQNEVGVPMGIEGMDAWLATWPEPQGSK